MATCGGSVGLMSEALDGIISYIDEGARTFLSSRGEGTVRQLGVQYSANAGRLWVPYYTRTNAGLKQGIMTNSMRIQVNKG